MAEPDTADLVLNAAATLIKERGFHGFSYQDVADRVGIRKASIHYHFPSKTDMGVAVLTRYRAMMRTAAERVAAAPADYDGWQALALFLKPIRDFGHVAPDACLCGVLAGEYLSLPEPMRNEIAGFFAEHAAWLSGLLEHGRRTGEFSFAGPAEPLARFILAAIEGAMMIKRTNADTHLVDEVIDLAAALIGRPQSATVAG